jgi:hypothetical protein
VDREQNIFLIESKNQTLLASTFLRFQEYYESPMFHGKIFSLEQYGKWYALVNGSFSYYSDWGGFNIPSIILDPFRRGQFDPLSDEERYFLDLLPDDKSDYYIIGSVYGNGSALKHEFVHALYYLYRQYKEDVLSHMNIFDTFFLIQNLIDMGYWEGVIDDEINAYSLDGFSELVKNIPDRYMPRFRYMRKLLAKVFFKHFGFYISRAKRNFILDKVQRISLD